MQLKNIFVSTLSTNGIEHPQFVSFSSKQVIISSKILSMNRHRPFVTCLVPIYKMKPV